MKLDVLCVLVSVVCGCWRVAGAGGKSERPCSAFAEPAVRARPPRTTQLKHNPRCWDVWGEQARSLHSPRASKCLYLQHLQAWLLLRIMENHPHIFLWHKIGHWADL